MRKFTPLFLLCFGVSCWGVQSKTPESSTPAITADTSTQNSSPDEKDILLQKVEELAERQKKTEQKVEKILEHVEGRRSNKSPLVELDQTKRQELKQGWEQIESQKASAMESIKNRTDDSGQEDYSSGIVSPEE